MKNTKFEANVIDYTHDGKGVVKYENYPIFVKDTILDEDVEVKIIKWKKKYGFGKVEKIIKANKHRVEPVCQYYQQCGGCQIQFMDYDMQKEFKLRKIKNAYAKQGIELDEIDFIDNDSSFQYRNKLSIPLKEENGFIQAGLYRENSNDIIGIKSCLIQENNINELLAQVVEALNQSKVKIYNKETLKGYLRQIVIKSSKANNQLLLGFVVNADYYNGSLEKVIETVLKQNKKVKTIVINFNNQNTNVILGKENLIVYGDGYITDTVNNLDFRISINSFYQVNSTQMAKLYNKAIELADLNENDVVFDAYCGVGTISSFISKKVKKAIGVDIVEAAIEDANINKTINELSNVEFYNEDVAKFMKENQETFTKIILDPPRKGASQEFLDDLVLMAAKTIVYIACDVATQARDVKFLVDQGYQIKEVCAVDMFSQTYHIENIVLLEKE